MWFAAPEGETIAWPAIQTGEHQLRERARMPEISRFFGIVIRMYAEAGAPHHRPHFHAYYQDAVAICAIDSVEVIAGSLPRRQQRLVEAWAELHQDELNENWKCLQHGCAPTKVDPLR